MSADLQSDRSIMADGRITPSFPAFLGILAVILLIQTYLRASSEWTDVFVRAGGELWAGEDFFATGSGYVYPPFMAWFAAPFSALPEWASRLGWYLLSMLALAITLTGAWALSGGPSLFHIPFAARRQWVIFWLGLGCGLSYTINAFSHQQIDVMIGGLLIGGAALLHTGRQLAPGMLFGIAAACKATPLLWGPYLVLRWRWIAATALGVTVIAVNLLPDTIQSPPNGGLWIAEWLGRFVFPSLHISTDAGLWHTALIYNQSLIGTAQRLFNTVPGFLSADGLVAPRTLLGAESVKAIVYGLIAVLLAVSALAARRAQRYDFSSPGMPSRQAFEYSLVLILMLLMSPMSGLAHFGTLLLPGFCLARTAMATGNRFVWAMLASAIVLALTGNKDLVGRFAYDLLLWLGSATMVSMLLWLACIQVLWTGSGAKPAIPAH